jgi:LysM repeat protein
LKVSESDLLAVNHIDDPRKLQIGQKLIVPAKAKAKKSGD